MNACCFIEPLDVLTLRGNKLFGEAGSYGESQMPPQPSVIAGAIRSALMARKGIDFRAFADNALMDEEFGSAAQPGTFRVTAFHLARRVDVGKVEAIYALPADLSVGGKDKNGQRDVRRLKPCLAASLQTSAATNYLAVLPEDQRGKPETGLWLNAEGWRAYLSGQEIDESEHLLDAGDLWKTEPRTGIGLDTTRRSVETGKLFTVQAVSMYKKEHVRNSNEKVEKRWDIGFLAQIEGADMPETLTLRLGGDGRAAQASTIGGDVLHEPNWKKLCGERRCRIVLTSPGLFEDGWLPVGVAGDGRNLRFDLGGIKAKLVCAAVPRSEVVSGWDLARKRPKAAQRVAPTGSVYWLEDLAATPEQLRKLAGHGLWQTSGYDASRRTEGYNRFTFATY